MFVVLAEAAIAADPAEGAFDDPAAGEDFKPGGVVRASYNLKGPTGEGAGPVDEFAGVAGVGPDEDESGELALEFLQDEARPVAVLKAGFVNDDGEDQAEGVDDEVAFAAVDLLSGVVAARPPFSVVLTD